MSESDLQRAVLELAKRLGFKSAHFRPGKTTRGRWITAVQGDGAGYPDLTLVGHGRLVFVELKSAKGRVSREQAEWITALEGVPAIEVHVWRPQHWLDGTVEAVLKGVG